MDSKKRTTSRCVSAAYQGGQQQTDRLAVGDALERGVVFATVSAIRGVAASPPSAPWHVDRRSR
jgi:hypothetical protein